MSDTELLERPKSRRYAKKVRGTTARLKAAVESCREDIEAILGKKQLTDEAKAQRISRRRAELMDEVDIIERQAEENIEIAKGGAPKLKVPRDAGEAALLESRKARAWSKAEKMLNTGRDPLEVAHFFAGEGDRLGLAVLHEEVGLWRSLHGEGENAKQAKRRTDELKQAIRDVERPLLGGKDAEAADGVEEVTRAAADLKTNVGMIRREQEGTYVLTGEDEDGSPVTFDLGTFAPREETQLAGGQLHAKAGVLGEVLRGGQLQQDDAE